jgi:hypothetical protein
VNRYFEIVDCDCDAGGGQTTVENSETNKKRGMVVMSEAMERG